MTAIANSNIQYLDSMGIQVWVRRQLEAPEPIYEPSVNIPTEEAQPEKSPPLNWETLQEQVKTCTNCDLYKTRTQTVFGIGNRNADLMLIGEAPGADEDAKGEPFVGRAGQLLNAMLYAIKLTREETYIANVIKCRPPSNRNPNNDEMACCNHFLQQQIALIKPKLIVATGRVPAQHLLDTTTPIGKLRGQQFKYNNIPLIATYHPAYLLRKPSEKRKSWQDLQFI
ncbi:MAG: uracil-DNA glycosylase, partial [Proteobacteria bacterium]|nr:uracil-DNA glycosylase [Pseudomonadota bacterium]